jgi:hypothetical protein
VIVWELIERDWGYGQFEQCSQVRRDFLVSRPTDIRFAAAGFCDAADILLIGNLKWRRACTAVQLSDPVLLVARSDGVVAPFSTQCEDIFSEMVKGEIVR